LSLKYEVLNEVTAVFGKFNQKEKIAEEIQMVNMNPSI